MDEAAKKTIERLTAERDALQAECDRLMKTVADYNRWGAIGPDGRARQDQRMLIRTQIELIGDFDIVRARGVDLSEGGIGFELDDDLPFEMRFTLDGRVYQKRARLVWVDRRAKGGIRLGLEFIPPQPHPEL